MDTCNTTRWSRGSTYIGQCNQYRQFLREASIADEMALDNLHCSQFMTRGFLLEPNTSKSARANHFDPHPPLNPRRPFRRILPLVGVVFDKPFAISGFEFEMIEFGNWRRHSCQSRKRSRYIGWYLYPLVFRYANLMKTVTPLGEVLAIRKLMLIQQEYIYKNSVRASTDIYKT